VLLSLERGKLHAIFDKITGNEPRVVKTPGALLAVRGTQYTIEVDAGGNTKLDVHEGVVEVRSPLQPEPLLVHAGEYTRFSPQRPPGDKPMQMHGGDKQQPNGGKPHSGGTEGEQHPRGGEPQDGRGHGAPPSNPGGGSHGGHGMPGGMNPPSSTPPPPPKPPVAELLGC
jgi:hypothetical protein